MMTVKPLNKAKNTPACHTSQSGNAMFIVLIGVVLFTALMFTFSRGAQQGGGNISNRRADLSASEILDYAAKHDRAIGRILSRYCSESDINFDNTMIPNYDNPTAPPENKCDVYHANGGGLSMTLIPHQWLDNAFSTLTGYGVPVFGGDARMLGVGNDTATDQDLILWIGFINRPTCEAINKRLGITTMPTFAAGPFAGLHYRGTFNDTWQAELDQPGLKSACAQEPGGTNAYVNDANTAVTGQSMTGSYHFYHVLLAR